MVFDKTFCSSTISTTYHVITEYTRNWALPPDQNQLIKLPEFLSPPEPCDDHQHKGLGIFTAVTHIETLYTTAMPTPSCPNQDLTTFYTDQLSTWAWVAL